ncbi:MAG: hypothetical protein AB7C98_04905 [Acidithiobacillus sp.]
MFALKALFDNDKTMHEAIASIKNALMVKHQDHPDYYAVLRKMTDQPLNTHPTVFAEKNVVYCEFYGFDEKESAMAEAALLDVGAIEVVVE